MLELQNGHEFHDEIVVRLQRSYAETIGRDILDGYGIRESGPSIVTYDTPVLSNGGRPDLVAIVHSGLGIHLTAAIEVKRALKDLVESGGQYERYIGHTSCFFIAVPEKLLKECMCVIQQPKDLRFYKGVINADSGNIVVLPTLQNHDVFCEAQLLCNIDGEPGYKAEDTGLYHPRAIPIRSYKPLFIKTDGIVVTSTYEPLLRSAMAEGYRIPSEKR